MKTKAEEKSRWRSYFKEQLRIYSEQGLDSGLNKINQNLTLILSKESGVWGGFKPHQMEPDLTQAIQASQHLRWAFPLVVDEQLQWWLPGPAGFQMGAFGIQEPIVSSVGEMNSEMNSELNGARKVEQNEISGLLIPGLGFDRSGVRLGRGRGYFDRFLGEWSGKKIGVAYSCQVVEELPSEAHDIRMDLIVTDHDRS